ncbi:hypothetical protein [Gluconacetobacter tumulisoli]|uniref:Uncharacterized protein n=1 Tax=Gluconacetobacter tumulisoli TaxID=1286189 RepID=A0A7W4K7Y6_9PROT|nr:hypothetical protein [Gluconacetobacter tumulisoli]MBB2201930.1 hypothetical protein [Gluconacetobacter tumulisoli]
MVSPDSLRLFKGIWQRALKEPSLQALTPDRIASWASEKGVADPITVARDVGMWVPDAYKTTDYLFGQDECVFAFETFRRWLKSHFFCNTADYRGLTWLNRHMFAHGTASSWQQPRNFSRLIVALATLSAIESWYDASHHVSFMLPEMNDASKLLAAGIVSRSGADANEFD